MVDRARAMHVHRMRWQVYFVSKWPLAVILSHHTIPLTLIYVHSCVGWCIIHTHVCVFVCNAYCLSFSIYQNVVNIHIAYLVNREKNCHSNFAKEKNSNAMTFHWTIKLSAQNIENTSSSLFKSLKFNFILISCNLLFEKFIVIRHIFSKCLI